MPHDTHRAWCTVLRCISEMVVSAAVTAVATNPNELPSGNSHDPPSTTVAAGTVVSPSDLKPYGA